jgi:hypothetical protein
MADIKDYFFPQDPAIFVYKDPYGKTTGGATRKEGSISVTGVLKKKEPTADPLLKYNASDLGFKPGSNPLSIQTSEQDLVSATREQATAAEKTATNIANQTQVLKDQQAQYRQEKLAAAGAKFGIDVLNTMNQYRNVSGVARFNIMQARNQMADAVYRGRQAGFQRQLEGQRAGEQSLLAMAAQGQSVSSESVQKIQRSYEAVGIENSMREEINGIREALGFQLEEISQEYQLEMAANQRDMSILSSALELGASAYGAGAFDGGL